MTINFHQIKKFINHYFTAKRNGHGVHSPLAYQLCEEVFYNKNHFYDFDELKKIRNELLNNQNEITIQDFGAGSKTFTSNQRKINILAKKGISSSKQSETLYKLINFLNSKTLIELGTSLGLNSLYLAKANKIGLLITVEGSENLKEFACNLATKNNISNIEFIDSTFEKALPIALSKVETLDFIYIDGNHRYETTMNYFIQALSKKNNNSVFVFDDIYWSEGMTKAWEEIKKHPSVTLSIDAFYFGMVMFREEIKEKVDLKFYL
ncbi:MAG: class I SAM-dependent methyltransferase [Bacteroidota bacterium]|nr:class I SAM-dependent methyltransferase [Bacteroidota bacterium]